MVERRKDLVLQGTRWVSSQDIDRLRRQAVEGDREAGRALHRAERRAGKIRYRSGVRLYALVLEDGYLAGASRAHAATSPSYWGWAGRQEGSWAIYGLDVPKDLADKLMWMGTPEQVFSDGYEAWDAAREYRKEIIDWDGYEMPEIP